MDSSATYSVGWNLTESLERLRHLLPTQGPIKNFIHHNTLHAFQHLRFVEGVETAGNIYGAECYLPVAEYQARYHKQQISDSALQRVGLAHGVPPSKLSDWVASLLEPMPQPGRPVGVAHAGMRASRKRLWAYDVDVQLHPLLFRLLASFLDQGISVWRMPHANDTFFSAVARIEQESIFPLLPGMSSEFRKLFSLPSNQVIESCLHAIVGTEANFEAYLTELCLSQVGWAGMVSVVEVQPASLLARRVISLQDYLAVVLIYELALLKRYAGNKPILIENRTSRSIPSATRIQHAWHEAFEWTFYERVLAALQKSAKDRRALEGAPPRYQAFFCIDDRECSLRRYLEEALLGVQTFGTAGFFGIDFLFQPATSAYAYQYCPVVLQPQHVVRELSTAAAVSQWPSLSELLHLSPKSNTLFRGWLLTQVLGLGVIFQLVLAIFWPSRRLLARRGFAKLQMPTRLSLLRESESRNADGLYEGYSFDEMADRVYRVLFSAGAVKNFAPLIVFVAHGASSANNPHFAAYDCGACSGKPGAPNARAFAWMANHPEVRVRLKQRGFEIPLETYFLGALHDTTQDTIEYFDTELVPPTHLGALQEFRQAMDQALGRNALERCRRFELAPQTNSIEAARRHVKDRAFGIFEPRPELNHATNALCLVGRREWTQDLFLDRRAFLNSYDPFLDPEGKTLAGIFGAVVPVCGGINLEYYFSRVDNAVYGAGTKLPHNVVALVGVSNGTEGDLRNGLPLQMIELHDPVRLMIVVEQEPAIVLTAIRQNSAIEEWVKHDWVYLTCVSPTDFEVYQYQRGQMICVHGLSSNGLPTSADWLEIVQGRQDNIDVTLRESPKKGGSRD